MIAGNGEDVYSQLAEKLLDVRLDDPEPTIDDMLAAFNDFSVSKSAIDVSQRSVASKQNLHELNFEVPAVSLLPRDAMPSLPPPYHVTRRECPRPSRNLDTSFNMRLATDNIHANEREVPALSIFGSNAESLCKHVNRLHRAPGISTLGFVAYEDEYDIIQYRASLSTTWHTAEGVRSEVKVFNNIDTEDWRQRLTCDTTGDWPKMIDHIMQRCSDRAFFHVQERLQAFDFELAVDQIETWAKQWGTASMHTAKDFLKHKISWDENSSCWEGKMPCGHMQAITPMTLVEQLTDHEAQEFACDTCGEYALSPENYEEVMTLQDRIDRVVNRFRQQCWSATKKQALLAGHQTFRVSHQEVRDAIIGAVYSFQEPESVVPYSMSLVYRHETFVIVQHINGIFGNDHYTTTIDTDSSPEALLDEFLDVLAEDAGVGLADDIDSVLPMGYHTFLYEWVSRAFIYLKSKNANRANDLADKLMRLMMSGSRNQSPRVGADVEAGPKCFDLKG